MRRLLSQRQIAAYDTEATLVTAYAGNLRSVRNLVTGNIVTERKIVRREENGPFYRYVVSDETRVSTASGEPTSNTYRMRHIFRGWRPVPGIIAEVHVTLRTMITLGENSRTTSSVSIEVEFPTDHPMGMINTVAISIMTIHNGWEIPNLPSIVDGMRANLNTTGLRSPNQLQRPFDITWRNITYANLIERPTAISFKADGVRMLLCKGFVGTFLVTSNLNIVPLNLNSSQGITLIDGELMGNTYWAFDLLFDNGTNYMPSPYNTRHENLTRILSTMRDITTPMRLPVIPDTAPSANIISVRVKPIIIPQTVDEFFNAVRSMRNYRDGDVPVETDGLILTPVNQGYSENVYKWKPSELMSVDFFIGRENGRIQLGTFASGDILFHPELQAEFPRENIDDLIGTVGEFEFRGENRWRYVRTRADKATPNSENVYEAITRLHADPISESVMTGQSFRLMRKYHNRMKDLIYDYIASQGVCSLTDIGSGRGGDLNKWARNSFLVQAIEPDPVHIEEFIERARSMGATVEMGKPIEIYGDTWEVDLHSIKAEDYVPTVVTGALTSFNSATFLGPTTLTCLADASVEERGFLVVLVIDGKRLAEQFLSNGSYESDLISIARVPCPAPSTGVQVGTETFGDLGCINITLHESATVDRGQTEGLVDVDVMINTLREAGWAVHTDMFFTSEQLLGREERMYSSAQRLLIFRRAQERNTIIRNIYRPLPVGRMEDIETPWGNVVRVGTLGTSTVGEDLSFLHSILQAADERYRMFDPVAKSVYLAARRGQGGILPAGLRLYLIPGDSWDMYMREGEEAYRYSARNADMVPREKGVVLFSNMGHWEPLAKRTLEGNLEYQW